MIWDHYIPPPFLGKGISPLIWNRRRNTHFEVKEVFKLLNKISIKCNREIYLKYNKWVNDKAIQRVNIKKKQAKIVVVKWVNKWDIL